MNYKSSLIGYHNPRLHSNLTAEEFLGEYVKSLKAKRFKKDGWSKLRLAEWIEKNWNDQVLFVKRLFY